MDTFAPDELPDLRPLVGSPLVMFGRAWHADGTRRVFVDWGVGAAPPMQDLAAAARSASVKATWNKNRWRVDLEGRGWRGFARVVGGPELALGRRVELLAQHTDESVSIAKAAEHVVRVPSFAPFVDLVRGAGAHFTDASLKHFASGEVFGWIALRKDGWSTFLRSELDGWLASHGFVRAGGEGEPWARGAAPPISVFLSDQEPDSLRIDIDGWGDFALRPAPDAPREPAGPPDAAAVLARAQCLAVMADRAVREARWAKARPAERAEVERHVAAVHGWLHATGLVAALSSDERKALVAPAGGWTKAHNIHLSWRAESASALAWSLGLLELPDAATEADPAELFRVVPLLASPREGVSSPRPAPGEVARAREEAGRNLDAGGKRGSIGFERHRALEWLRRGGDWDDTSLNEPPPSVH